MSVYFVAQISITNEIEYSRYLDKCDEVFSKYSGKYLAVDNSPTVLEGKWKHNRMVIIEFSCESDFRSWYESPEYQSILKHRLKGDLCDSLLVKGL